MSTVIPFNKRLKVSLVEKKKEKKPTWITIPEDVKIDGEPYQVCVILDQADDCTCDFDERYTHVVVESQMLERVEVNEQELFFIKENYVVCGW